MTKHGWHTSLEDLQRRRPDLDREWEERQARIKHNLKMANLFAAIAVIAALVAVATNVLHLVGVL